MEEHMKEISKLLNAEGQGSFVISFTEWRDGLWQADLVDNVTRCISIGYGETPSSALKNLVKDLHEVLADGLDTVLEEV